MEYIFRVLCGAIYNLIHPLEISLIIYPAEVLMSLAFIHPRCLKGLVESNMLKEATLFSVYRESKSVRSKVTKVAYEILR